MSVSAGTIAGVLDEVLGFMEEALQENQSLQTKNAELQAKVQTTEKVYLEKVAAAKASPVFSDEAINEALNRLVDMQVMTQANAVKVASDLRKKPEQALQLMVKLAETLLSAPGEGAGIEKSAAAELQAVDSGDPDGWDAMRAGRRVPLKR